MAQSSPRCYSFFLPSSGSSLLIEVIGSSFYFSVLLLSVVDLLFLIFPQAFPLFVSATIATPTIPSTGARRRTPFVATPHLTAPSSTIALRFGLLVSPSASKFHSHSKLGPVRLTSYFPHLSVPLEFFSPLPERPVRLT